MIFRSKTSSAFFEARYQSKVDPWNFAQSPYEQGRYATIIGALGGRRYRRAFEPGCSVGVLTEQLAALCDEVDACDFSGTAVERAGERCHALPNVKLSCNALTIDTPLGGYDLIILSEIGYYFRLRRWRAMVAKLVASTPPGTTVLASHWLGTSEDHRISGDAVHEVLLANPSLRHEHGERHEAFRLDRFTRV